MKFIKLLTLLFLLPSFGGVGGELHAQDPQLFEHTWYLHDLVIDGTSNIPPINSEIPYVPAEFFEDGVIYTGMCEEGGAGTLEYIGTTEFNIIELNFLQGGCAQNHPVNQDYSGLYQNFWALLGVNEIPYEITEAGEIRTLVISSPNNDYAIYKNEVPLSIMDVSEFDFFIYPNPVIETLHINNGSKQQVTATIYDVSGKALQKHSFENNNETMDVKALNPGLYFVVFENEMGERVSKKFVKK